MIVVSNTSPIMNLAAVGRLELLERLYGRVSIPPAVAAELRGLGLDEFDPRSASRVSWIEERRVGNRVLGESLRLELHPGEAEAIGLSLEIGADLVLLDERLARKVASRVGLRFTGVLGVLIAAKRKHLIEAVRPVLDELIVKAGFWVRADLHARVLREADE